MFPEPTNLLSEKITTLSRKARRSSRKGAWRIASDLPASFRYAAQGLAYGFVSQRNFRIHLGLGAVVFGLGLWLNLKYKDPVLFVRLLHPMIG